MAPPLLACAAILVCGGVLPSAAAAQTTTEPQPDASAEADATQSTAPATTGPQPTNQTSTTPQATTGAPVPGPLALDPNSDNSTTTTTVDPLVDEPPGETVPESAETVPPPPGAYDGQTPFEPPTVLWSSVRAAEQRVAAAEQDLVDAVEKVRDGRVRLKRLEERRRSLGGEHQQALVELADAERVLVERSVAAFVGSDVGGGPVVNALRGADHDQHESTWIRSEYVTHALARDDLALARYRELRADLDQSVRATGDAIRVVEQRLTADERQVPAAASELAQAQDELEAFAAGSAIYISGATFPIAWPYDTPLIDSFGFPRMPGTPDEHWHEGIDLFAPAGTPLLAAERGVIIRISTGRLGGLTFWLKGESGAHWYYAHLQSYAEGLAVGDVVEAGQVLGYVGNTGNAVGTPPHLHLELHPDGAAPVNPYPLLKVLSDRERAEATSQPIDPAPSAD